MKRIIEIDKFCLERNSVIGIGPLKQREEYNYTILFFDVLLQGQILKFEKKYITRELSNPNTNQSASYDSFCEHYEEVKESIKKSIAARKNPFLSPSKKRN